jgi:dTDP-4-amino-4,6-dideoxygalactose transaminase
MILEDSINVFENTIANFFGAPFAVATDCCTHAIELCLRYEKYDDLEIPEQTYISIPFTAEKLNLKWKWKSEKWEDYYYIGNTNIIDAAVFWQQNSYITGTYMCLSFQYKKHLNLGRGGIILLDDIAAYTTLKRMVYDGRYSNKSWVEQNIDTIGYHYYMTPEIAFLGIEKFKEVAFNEVKRWGYQDYPLLPNMEVFNRNGFGK